jgi:phosphohistidine phosphatase
MELYLLRHAEAGDAPQDKDRQLTEHGRAQAGAAAAGIASLALGIELLLSSPLVRAVQTAEPVAKALSLPLANAEALTPGRTPAEALELLAASQGPVLMVGHEPQLSGIVMAVTGGRVRMRKAMLARLELETEDPAQGKLGWLLSWQHLKKLG